MKTKNWDHIYNNENYKGRWVALKDDEVTVVGSGNTLKEAIADAEKNGHEHPIMTKVPERHITFAGAAL